MVDELIDGRYRPLERRAVGGMASVWRARDEWTGEIVAIKRLHPFLVADADARRRLAREAAALEAIDHPAIIRARGMIEDPGVPGLVMEYAAGQPLDRRIAADGPLAPEEAVAIVGIVADALATAHETGIVHRDVKPANILVEKSGAVHLVDFGIASLRDAGDPAITAPTDVVGTIRYTAPERLMGAPATTRSDVWALGAVLFELLTGTPAMTGDDPAELMVAGQQGPPDAAALPPALARIVRRALAADPDDRFPDATSFRDALSAVDAPPDPVDGDAPTLVVPFPASASGIGRADATPRWLSPVDRAAAVFFGGVLLVALVVAIGFGVSGFAGDRASTGSAAQPSAEVVPADLAPVATPSPDQDTTDGGGDRKGKGHGKGRGGD